MHDLLFARDVEAEYVELLSRRYQVREGYMLRVQAAALRRLRQRVDLLSLARSLGLETWDVSRIMRIRWIYSPFQMTDFWDEHYIEQGPDNSVHGTAKRLVKSIKDVGVVKTAEINRLTVERLEWMLSQEPVTPFQIEDYSWYLT